MSRYRLYTAQELTVHTVRNVRTRKGAAPPLTNHATATFQLFAAESLCVSFSFTIFCFFSPVPQEGRDHDGKNVGRKEAILLLSLS